MSDAIDNAPTEAETLVGETLPGVTGPDTDVGAKLARARLRARLFGAEPAPTQIGRYRVIDRIGSGGFGEVFAAYDDQLDRRVALKVVRTPSGAEAVRDSVLREAQLLAQLSHPNVVAVFDVTTQTRRSGEDEVVIAMELVEGKPLSRWLEEGDHRWLRVLGTFAQAGRGLAAAHAAGVIHRDFKPANAIVGEDGRVRVLDFGLARRGHLVEVTTTAADDDEPSGPIAIAAPGDTGTVEGTPAYMSPEQHLGERLDARTDQYSFCVSLWQALTGALPFSGETPWEIREAKLAGPPPLPTGTDVPTKVFRALRRGMAVDPTERFASLDDLLVALRVDPGRRWRIVAGIAVVAAAAGIGYAVQPDDGPVCDGGQAQMAEVFDDARRTRVRAVFEDSKLPYAASTGRDALASLDAWRDGWQTAHRQACVAKAGDAAASDELDLQMQCLRRHLQSLDAVVDVLATADDEAIANARKAVDGLPNVADCADPETLRERYPLPPAQADREAIAAARQHVARSRAQADAGHYDVALQAAEDASAAAGGLDFPPLQAEIDGARGHALALLGRYGEAQTAFENATATALQVGDHETFARAATDLLWLFGADAPDFPAAHRWEGLAQASIRRLGEPLDLQLTFLSALGSTRMTEGKYDEAIAAHERGLQLVDANPQVGRHRAIGFVNNIANVYYTRGDAELGLQWYRRAIALATQDLGPEHPNTLTARSNLIAALQRFQRFDEAVAEAEDVVDRLAQTQGRDNPAYANALINLAIALDSQGRPLEAVSYLQEALGVFERTAGPDSMAVTNALVNLVQLQMRMGYPERAQATAQRTLDIQIKHLGEAHLDCVYTLVNLANADRFALDAAAGKRHAQQAIETAAKAGVPDHYIVGVAYAILAAAEIELGDAQAGLDAGVQARRIVDAAVGPEHSEAVTILIGRADALAVLGRTAQAEQAVAEASARLATMPGARDSYAAHIGFVRAQLAKARGDGDEAAREVEAIVDDLDPPTKQRAERLLAP